MSIPEDVPALQAPQYVATYSLGPQQMGYTAQILLLGVFTTLFGGYAISGELERHRLLGRVALWTSLVLNWGYTGLCVYESYVAAVSQHRTSQILISSNIAWQFLPLLSGLTGVVTQGFLTSHALVLIPRKALRPIFSGVMGVLIAGQMTGFTMACINGIWYVNGSDDIAGLGYNKSLSLWLWTSAAADILISTVCAFSIRQRLSGYTRETDTVVVKLAVICFRTAAYTTTMSITGAIMASVYSGDFDVRSFAGFPFWLVQPALYGIALFTFSRSSRRVVDTQPRISPVNSPVLMGGERKRAAPPPRLAHEEHEHEHEPVTSQHRESRRFYPSSATLSTTGATRPLAIRVDCERVISIDEPNSARDEMDQVASAGSVSGASSHGRAKRLEDVLNSV